MGLDARALAARGDARAATRANEGGRARGGGSVARKTRERKGPGARAAGGGRDGGGVVTIAGGDRVSGYPRIRGARGRARGEREGRERRREWGSGAEDSGAKTRRAATRCDEKTID